MTAVRYLVRSTWHRHRLATASIAVLAAMLAALVAACLQSAALADTAVDRYLEASRGNDMIVGACPVGVDPYSAENPDEARAACGTPDIAEEMVPLLQRVPGVESTTAASTAVLGILQPDAPNGWGRGILAELNYGPTEGLVGGHPIVVTGRLPAPGAADEVVIGEASATAAGIKAGDVIDIASWRQDELDASIDGNLAPTTPPIRSRVVGIVRSLTDFRPSSNSDAGLSYLPTFLYAGPAWSQAHGRDLAAYGFETAVRLDDGPAGAAAFDRAARTSISDRVMNVQTLIHDEPKAVRRTVDSEREALLVVSLVTAIASIVLVGIIVAKQIQRELVEGDRLLRIGFSRRDLRLASILRSLSIGVPAAVVAVLLTGAATRVVPVGTTRLLAFGDTSLDPLLLVGVAAVTCLFFLAVGTIVRVRAQHAGAPERPVRVPAGLRSAPTSLRFGFGCARERSAAYVAVVGVVAVAALVTAGVTVASLTRVMDEPDRYGAWWDVAVGQYSDAQSYDAGAASVASIPGITQAAGFNEVTDTGTIDGHPVPLMASEDIKGSPTPVMATGRPPVGDHETALGTRTADRLGIALGDIVDLGSNDDPSVHQKLEVVGTYVVNDPISTEAGIDGAYVSPELLISVGASVPQSIAVAVADGPDGAAAMDRLSTAFPGSMRTVSPPEELNTLSVLRFVPWVLAALIAVLGAVAYCFGVVTLLTRRRRELAVLGALGFRRRERLGVGLWTSMLLMSATVVVGVPIGVALGRRLWLSISDRVSIPSGPVVPWLVVLAITIGAGVIASSAALVGGWLVIRPGLGTSLRTE